MRKFVKFDDFWWEYDDSTPKEKAKLINMVGGYNTGNDITNCEIVEANDFDNLDWYGTTVYDNNYKYGWIDREGNFYGCDYREHGLQAELVHHSTRIKLERAGWIHISKDMMSDTGKTMANFCGDYENGIMPTDAQVLYLSKHSEIENWQVMYCYTNGNKEKARIYEHKLKEQQEKQSAKQDNNDKDLLEEKTL